MSHLYLYRDYYISNVTHAATADTFKFYLKHRDKFLHDATTQASPSMLKHLSSRNVYVFDGFARKCDLLNHPLPAMAKILFSYEKTFIINVSYACRQLP